MWVKPVEFWCCWCSRSCCIGSIWSWNGRIWSWIGSILFCDINLKLIVNHLFANLIIQARIIINQRLFQIITSNTDMCAQAYVTIRNPRLLVDLYCADPLFVLFEELTPLSVFFRKIWVTKVGVFMKWSRSCCLCWIIWTSRISWTKTILANSVSMTTINIIASTIVCFMYITILIIRIWSRCKWMCLMCDWVMCRCWCWCWASRVTMTPTIAAIPISLAFLWIFTLIWSHII